MATPQQNIRRIPQPLWHPKLLSWTSCSLPLRSLCSATGRRQRRRGISCNTNGWAAPAPSAGASFWTSNVTVSSNVGAWFTQKGTPSKSLCCIFLLWGLAQFSDRLVSIASTRAIKNQEMWCSPVSTHQQPLPSARE